MAITVQNWVAVDTQDDRDIELFAESSLVRLPFGDILKTRPGKSEPDPGAELEVVAHFILRHQLWSQHGAGTTAETCAGRQFQGTGKTILRRQAERGRENNEEYENLFHGKYCCASIKSIWAQ